MLWISKRNQGREGISIIPHIYVALPYAAWSTNIGNCTSTLSVCYGKSLPIWYGNMMAHGIHISASTAKVIDCIMCQYSTLLRKNMTRHCHSPLCTTISILLSRNASPKIITSKLQTLKATPTVNSKKSVKNKYKNKYCYKHFCTMYIMRSCYIFWETQS